MKAITIFVLSLVLFGCQQNTDNSKSESNQAVAEQKSELQNDQQIVNLYSARKEDLMAPLLEAFSTQTGIKVNILSGKADALLSRIQSEALTAQPMYCSPLMPAVCTAPSKLAYLKLLNLLVLTQYQRTIVIRIRNGLDFLCEHA